MPAAITLGDARGVRGLGSPNAGCRCVRGGRNKRRGVLLCPVPKSKKHPSGYAFRKGDC